MALYANLDKDSKVLQIIVCDDPNWINKRLKGIWVETKETSKEIQGGGIGMYYTDGEFLYPWEPRTDSEAAYPAGTKLWYNGSVITSTKDLNLDSPDQDSWSKESTSLLTRSLNFMKSLIGL